MAGMERQLFESFYLGGSKVGVILRRVAGSGVQTVTCFAQPDGPLFHVESRIRFDGAPDNWSSYRYEDRAAGTVVEASRAERPESAREALPSYCEFLLAVDVAGAPGGSRAFTRLVDSDPTAAPQPGLLRNAGDAVVESSDGQAIRCRQVQLTIGGRPANTFWIADGAPVKSDWAGAEYREPSLDRALSGVPGLARAAIAAGVGDLSPPPPADP